MINISMDGMCKECPFAEVELSKTVATGIGIDSRIILDAKCVHELACLRIWTMRDSKKESND